MAHRENKVVITDVSRYCGTKNIQTPVTVEAGYLDGSLITVDGLELKRVGGSEHLPTCPTRGWSH